MPGRSRRNARPSAPRRLGLAVALPLGIATIAASTGPVVAAPADTTTADEPGEPGPPSAAPPRAPPILTPSSTRSPTRPPPTAVVPPSDRSAAAPTAIEVEPDRPALEPGDGAPPTRSIAAPAAPAPPSVVDAPGSDPHDHERGHGPHADPGLEVREPSATPPRPPADARPIAFTAGLQVYLRGQTRMNREHSPRAGDRQHELLGRVRASLLTAAGPLQALVQFQDARTWGFEASTVSNEANTDLHQGYLEAGGGSEARGGFLRVGRQEIVLGSRRFFADRNWNPSGQAFDGLRLHGVRGRFSGDALAIVLGPPRTMSIDDPDDPAATTTTMRTRGSYVGALFLSATLRRGFKSQVIVVALSERPSPRRPDTRRDLVDAGARIFGEVGPGLRYDLEAHGQLGREQQLPHRAVAAWGELGYVLRRHRRRPGVFTRVTYASGSRCRSPPATGACGEAASHDFYRFWGLRHAYHGIVDRAGLTNLLEVELGASMRPHDKLELTLDAHFFQLAEPAGRWIGGQGDRLVGAGWDPTNTRRTLGQELDLVVHARPLPPLTLQPGYGVFIPLAAGRELAGPAVQHFVYLWVIADF